MRALACAFLVSALPVSAHDGVDHATDADAQAHVAKDTALPPATPLPFDVGGSFELRASTGGIRKESDPDGHMQLLFFGYANCEQICSAALPLMGEMANIVGRAGIDVTPVMITVDPLRDTTPLMAEVLTAIHPDFVGLTGDAPALQVSYDAFSVEREWLFDDTEGQPVYAHGSFIYLLDGAGDVLTLIPPVLPPEQAARIVAKYATGS